MAQKHRHKFHVLIADDDEDDRLLVKQAIDESLPNIDSSFVDDGEELLQYLQHCSTEPKGSEMRYPQLILLDLNMPKMNGMEALRRIRADDRHNAIPVVVLSTTDNVHDINLSYKLGANSFFIKPLNSADLIRMMAVLGVYWFETARLPIIELLSSGQSVVKPKITATILIIDDSSFARKALNRILRLAGHNTLEATDEKTALYICRTKKPDLVLLDLRMAGLQAKEIIPKLREIDAKVRVLIATGNGEELTREEIERSGAIGVFYKPIFSESILKAIDSAMVEEE
ncbi:MAG: response regulator [Syntrophobacteraceae bacterium]|jgi:CheY-like chemotaxis protein